MFIGIGGAQIIKVGASAFSPANISGLLLWLKGDKGLLDASDAPITADSTAIKTWQDQSGNNNHATQATAGSRPICRLGANGQNGLPLVQLNGTSQFLSLASNVTPQTNFTYFLVMKATRVAAFGYLNRAQGIVDATNIRGLTIGLSTTNYYVVMRSASAANYDFQASGTYTNTLTSCVKSSTVDGGTLRINKSTVATNAAAVGWGLSGAATEYIGRDPAFYFQGNICEILVYNTALSASNTSAVENYLAAKWAT